GQVWKVSAAGGNPVCLTTEPGEYYRPTWTPDGAAVVATRGPGPSPAVWNGWNRQGGWTAVRIPATGGPVQAIDSVGQQRGVYFGPEGRLFFEFQENPTAAAQLYQPFPPETALRQVIRVRSVRSGGGDPRDHLRFPPR